MKCYYTGGFLIKPEIRSPATFSENSDFSLELMPQAIFFLERLSANAWLMAQLETNHSGLVLGDFREPRQEISA